MRKKLAVIILSIMVSVTMFPLSVLASNETAQQDKGGALQANSPALRRSKAVPRSQDLR